MTDTSAPAASTAMKGEEDMFDRMVLKRAMEITETIPVPPAAWELNLRAARNSVIVQWFDEHEELARKIIGGEQADAAAAERVPDEYVLVPKEPTKFMIAQGLGYLRNNSPTNLWAAWDAMIAAATPVETSAAYQASQELASLMVEPIVNEQIKTLKEHGIIPVSTGWRDKERDNG